MRQAAFWMVGLVMVAGSLWLGSAAQAAMVAYWKFDGDYLDSSGNGYDGTPVNGPGFAAGVSGQALQLSSGSSQYVSTVTADLLGLTGNTFTAVAWVRPNATNGDRTVFGTDTGSTSQGLHLIIRNGRAYFGFRSNDTGGNGIIPAGQWSHMVWQFDNGQQRIIVNGRVDASTGGHANFQNTWDPVLIGRWASGNYFDGLLDEVVIYNEALAPNQVMYLAGGGDPANLPAPDPNSFYGGTPTGPVLLGPMLPNGKRNAYQLVVQPDGLTWDQARVDAAQHTYMGVPGHLVTIHNTSENAFVHAFGSDQRWIGFTDSNATSTLDGQTMPGGGSSTNQFRWITGEPVTYAAWASGEPNNAGGEDAATIRGDGLWKDLPAGSTLGQADRKLTQYIIEYEIQAPGSANGVRLLPKLGPVKPDGTRNAYEMILNPSTWVAAKVDAQNRQYMGVQGHLVTLTSAEEDTFVRTLGKGWIGLTDDPNHAPGAFEGGNQSTWPSPPQGEVPEPGEKGYGWAWVTGEPLTYHNWNSAEPNNSGGAENYAEMTPGWNDLPNATSATRPYVVEYDINWQAQPAFHARMVQIGSGGADTQLNSAGEALSVALGFGVGAAAGNRYQVITDASHQPLEINYGSGSAGNFPLDIAYPNGQVDPGEDFTVRVTSRLYIPEGEWTIAFAGDDGGYLHLDGIQFINQIHTNNDWKANDGTLIWQDQTSHSVTIGHFVVPPGGITTTLDAMTFERAGGQHFEISIAPGHWPGYNAQAFGLLADGQYGWRATPIPAQNGFNVVMLQLDPSNPSGFDNEINNTQEAVQLISNVTGPGDYNIGGSAYRVSKFIVTQSPYVDFGGAGNFNEPTLLYPDGTSDAGEDFLVGVQAFIRMPPGTWTIGFASDDGGVLRLINTHGSPIQFTQEFNTNGDGVLDDTLFYNDTRGHSATWGIFTLTSEAYLELQGLFFERASGDSYEIFLAKGAFTEFNTTDFFILRNGVFPGVLVAPELLAVVPEPSSLALLALGGLGLVGLALRERKNR